MADVNAKIDQNFDKVGLAVTDDANTYTKPLLVEPILDYLEIDLVVVSSHISVDATPKEDQNFEYVQLASNESTGLAKPLKVDATNGRLWLDVTIMP